jgi:hypothetical protein
MNTRALALLAAVALLPWRTTSPAAGQPRQPPKPAPKKVVLIAGPLDKGHPPGTHEYEKSVRLLQDCLKRSPDVKGLAVEAHFNGRPADPKSLDDAATVTFISSGADRNARDHPLLVGDRLKVLDKQMKRGCGLVVVHWGLFVPEKNGGAQFLDWIGGYFDYERGSEGPKNSWYSKIRTAASKARPASPKHPVCRGVGPFEVREEFYYHIRFRPGDPRRVLFGLLVKMLKDSAEGNRLQAAYFLSLLNDPRSEPPVAKVRSAAVSQRLASAPLRAVGQVWAVGPFPDDKGGKAVAHPPETGAIDLSARYSVAGRKLEWKTVAGKDRLDLPRPPGWSGPGSFYLYFRLQSLQPEKADLLATTFERVDLWHNGSPVPAAKAVTLDLHPGSNDFLVRLRSTDGQAAVGLQFRATGRVEAALPEKLGLGTLAERLKSAAGKEGDLAKFLAVD